MDWSHPNLPALFASFVLGFSKYLRPTQFQTAGLGDDMQELIAKMTLFVTSAQNFPLLTDALDRWLPNIKLPTRASYYHTYENWDHLIYEHWDLNHRGLKNKIDEFHDKIAERLAKSEGWNKRCNDWHLLCLVWSSDGDVSALRSSRGILPIHPLLERL